jgi:hypothetical protein
MTETLIKLPYRLKRVVQQTGRLHEALLPYAGQILTGELWEQLLRELRQVIPSAQEHALRNSVRPFLGLFLQARDMLDLAQLLAGNEHTLIAGGTVMRWLAQREPEWVPVHVVAFEATETRERKPAARYQLKVLAGSACPLILEKVWPSRFVPLLARRLGYTGRRGGLLFGDVSELVNLCLVVQLEPRLTRNNRPGFEVLGCTAAILARNRKIIQKRFRRDGRKAWPCPRDYRHHCYQCPVGFVDCPAATHALTYGVINASIPAATQ